MNQVELYFSIVADPLEEQLNKQGMTLGENPERYDNMMRSIFGLMMSGLLTRKESDNALIKLNKLVRKRMEVIK
jgi:hypothetical protein